MRGEKRERWMDLRAQAAEEQDPDTLMKLVAEIDRMLSEKQDRLNQLRTGRVLENGAPSKDESGNSSA